MKIVTVKTAAQCALTIGIQKGQFVDRMREDCYLNGGRL